MNSCWFYQELVQRFNFHNFDNVRKSKKKTDPRAQKSEAKGLSVVSLLFSAASGDLVAMRRYVITVDLLCQCKWMVHSGLCHLPGYT